MDKHNKGSYFDENDEWKSLQNALIKATKEWTPETKSFSKNKWMKKKKLGKMDDRRLKKNDLGIYKQLNKEIQKCAKKQKKNIWSNVVRKLKSWKRKICR